MPRPLILAPIQDRMLERAGRHPKHLFHLLTLQMTHTDYMGCFLQGEAFGLSPCLCTMTSSLRNC